MKKITILIFTFFLSPAFADPLKAVQDVLRDPESARFTNVQNFPNGNACGLVNAKNAYGGYVGRQPWKYISGLVFIDKQPYDLGCDHAKDPVAYENRMKMKIAEEKLATQKREAARLLEQKKIEEENYKLCKDNTAAFIDELQYSIKNHYRKQQYEDLKGSIEINGRKVDIKECGNKFYSEIIQDINKIAQNIFTTYCIDNYNLRLIELHERQGLTGKIGDVCGPEITNKAVSELFDFGLAYEKEKKNSPNDPKFNSDRQRCNDYKDLITIGDRLTRKYYTNIYIEKCGFMNKN